VSTLLDGGGGGDGGDGSSVKGPENIKNVNRGGRRGSCSRVVFGHSDVAQLYLRESWRYYIKVRFLEMIGEKNTNHFIVFGMFLFVCAVGCAMHMKMCRRQRVVYGFAQLTDCDGMQLSRLTTSTTTTRSRPANHND
jgi:hypothetical protein